MPQNKSKHKITLSLARKRFDYPHFRTKKLQEDLHSSLKAGLILNWKVASKRICPSNLILTGISLNWFVPSLVTGSECRALAIADVGYFGPCGKSVGILCRAGIELCISPKWWENRSPWRWGCRRIKVTVQSTLEIKVSLSIYSLQRKTKLGDMLKTDNCTVWCIFVVYKILYFKNIIEAKNGLYKD